MIADVLVAVLLCAGGLWVLIAAIGVVRMPDALTRMHPATKAATLGLGCILVAVAIHFAEVDVATRSLLIALFVFLTAPVAAHRIGRVAFLLDGGGAGTERSQRPSTPRGPEARSSDSEPHDGTPNR